MMGEVVGYAAKLCKENATSPRGVYENHLKELIYRLQALENHETAKPNIEMQMHNDQ
jgi:hypothetical protein